jgi:hypothetical protein
VNIFLKQLFQNHSFLLITSYKSRGEISGDFPLQVRDVDFLKPYLKTALPLLQVEGILA